MATNINQLARQANVDGRAPVGTAAALEGVRALVDEVTAAIRGGRVS